MLQISRYWFIERYINNTDSHIWISFVELRTSSLICPRSVGFIRLAQLEVLHLPICQKVLGNENICSGAPYTVLSDKKAADNFPTTVVECKFTKWLFITLTVLRLDTFNCALSLFIMITTQTKVNKSYHQLWGVEGWHWPLGVQWEVVQASWLVEGP